MTAGHSEVVRSSHNLSGWTVGANPAPTSAQTRIGGRDHDRLSLLSDARAQCLHVPVDTAVDEGSYPSWGSPASLGPFDRWVYPARPASRSVVRWSCRRGFGAGPRCVGLHIRGAEPKKRPPKEVRGITRAGHSRSGVWRKKARHRSRSVPIRHRPSSAACSISSTVSGQRLASSFAFTLPQTTSTGLSSGA